MPSNQLNGGEGCSSSQSCQSVSLASEPEGDCSGDIGGGCVIENVQQPSLVRDEQLKISDEQIQNANYQQQYDQWYQQYGQQQYSQYNQFYQQPAIGSSGAFTTLQCFSGDQIVNTPNGEIRMDELKIGDMVLTVDESLVRKII